MADANFQIAASIIIAAVLFFLYRASVDLDEERHSALRMGLFYAAIGVGWAALNVVIQMAAESAASATLQQGIVIVYQAYTTIGVLAVIYLGIRFFQFTFSKFLDISRALTGQKVEGEEPW